MKHQVIAIHGGTSFNTHKQYISFLRTRELTKEALRHCDDWRSSLAAELGDAFEVLVPKMPNGTNAHYAEWCIWLERCMKFIEDDAVLIGHSLGGIFLVKYISEHAFPRRIKAVILVSAPYDQTLTAEFLTDFSLPKSLDGFSRQVRELYLVYSKDDPVVSIEEQNKYMRALPCAHVLQLDNWGHFQQQHFPELIELIRSL